MPKGKRLSTILTSILFIIMEFNGFFFTYSLLAYALDILSRFTVVGAFVMAALSTWGIFANLLKKGD